MLIFLPVYPQILRKSHLFIVVLVLAGILFLQNKFKAADVSNAARATSKKLELSKQQRTDFTENKKSLFQSGIVKEKMGEDWNQFDEMISSFDLPLEIEREVILAIEEGEEIDSSRGDSAEEFEKANEIIFVDEGSLPRQKQALVSSYHLNDEFFNELMKVTKTKENETPDSASLKSEALMHAGFSAMTAGKFERAEQAFREIIESYTATEPAPVAALELARLMGEQGRLDEAIETINVGIRDFADNEDFVKQAKKIKQGLMK